MNQINLYNIESIEELNDQDVYDISLDDNLEFFQDEHNYVANGVVVHNSHASGICISDIPLGRIAPLRRASKETLATQYTMEQLESLGLIKFDVLAISTLTSIKRAVKLIKTNYDIEIDIENLKTDDELTFELYRTGNLAGVFQCEQWGMRQTMRDIGVDSFNDLMAGISLYRPGPMESIPEYCGRKKEIYEVDYFHSSIEKHVKKFLEITYGIIVYQEQIMQICNALAGFSINDGYVMIKAIGKKKQYLMDKFERQFVDGCVKNDVPRNIAQQYWDKFVKPFASYGFNKSHAAAYSLTSYTTCYLKANYPDEFISALLSVESERAHHDKVQEFERDFAKKMDIKFLSKDINKSKASYVIEQKKDNSIGVAKTSIRYSLLCKGVGLKAAQHIEQNQPYENLKNFAEKTESSIVDSRVVFALAENGFFKNKKDKKSVEKFTEEFVKINNDLKMAAKKGVESVDIFG
jgi:DNA polymerase III subunit alpha